MHAAVLVDGAPYTAPSPQRTEESPRAIDSGLICLVMLARFHSLVADPEQLKPWFIPAVVKYRRLLLEVLFVSLVLQLFALVTPMFFQAVKAGELLIERNARAAAADVDRVGSHLASVRMQAARAKAFLASLQSDRPPQRDA